MAFKPVHSFPPEALKIVTVDSFEKVVLRTQTSLIEANELDLAREIAEKLYLALKPHFPAAGLAAPQIGISKAVFIFSYDRDPEHLEAAINPSYEPVGETQISSWEGCFSTMPMGDGGRLAKVSRYEKIRASYQDLNGNRIEKIFDGFAAKVFQHECDHLKGVLTLDRKETVVKTFPSKEEMAQFFLEVKKEDSKRYRKPEE